MPMPYGRNVDYSLIKVWLAVIVIVLLTVLGDSVILPAFNNLQRSIELQGIEATFKELRHPIGTERLSLRTAAGDFSDSEQGCDFYVGEVRSFDGDEEIILAAYADQVVRDNPLQVLFLEGGEIAPQTSYSLPEPLNDLDEWELPSDVGRSRLYMVYLAIEGYAGEQELDCR